MQLPHHYNTCQSARHLEETIDRFQVLRHRMAQLSSEVEALQAFSYHCCQMYAEGIYDVKLCSMAKLLATELAEKVATQCLQVYGGYGFMEEYPMARMYRDVRVGTIGGGSSEIMREIIAKMIIDDVDYAAGNKGAKGIVDRTVANKASTKETESNDNGIDLLELVKQKAGAAAAIGNTLKFNFGEDQIFVDGTGSENQVSINGDDADCTLTVSKEDFQRLLSGDLNPMSAVMSGKVKIDGDMGVAMKLQTLFS